MSQQVVTPQMVEFRLRELSKEIDDSHKELQEAESHYLSTKAQYEIAMARSRLNVAKRSAPNGKNYSISEREDIALIENEELHMRMSMAEAVVRGARANANRVKTQVDIARSIGTSVRTSMEV